MKNAALLIGVIIILSGVAWFLFNSAQIAEAPNDLGGVHNTPPANTVPGLPPQTGPSVNSFADCVAAGNPVMESYPRQCRHGDQHFIEEIPDGDLVACTADAKICPDGSGVGRVGPDCEFAPCPGEIEAGADPEPVICTPESRENQICTREYAPVCGLVEVQCVTTPCPPIPETFGNGCTACAQGNVTSYTQGECRLDNI